MLSAFREGRPASILHRTVVIRPNQKYRHSLGGMPVSLLGERLHSLRNALGSLHLGKLRWECSVAKDGRASWGPPSSCLCDPSFSSRTVASVQLIQLISGEAEI